MSDDELFSALSEIADEEIMAKNRASIVEVGRRIRRAALEEAANLVETTRETTTIIGGGDTQRHLTPRKVAGDLTGMTWVAVIRELANGETN